MPQPYSPEAHTREQIDAMPGAVVVEFGANWCGWCQRAQPLIVPAFAGHEAIRHIKVEDGPGRPLGRSFRIKLWPTLVFMKDGREVARVTRPANERAVADALAQVL